MKTKLSAYSLLFILAVIIPFISSLKSIWTGGIPFWFDPARDFLLALENQKKISLIGQPTGIPGVFYGPYWIWLISLGLYIDKNPRFIATLLLTLPYFTLFPWLLYKMRHMFGKTIVLLLWLMFILAYNEYTLYLWNPHLAPLLLLGLIYLMIATSQPLPNLKKIGIAGIVAGLITNIHMSFGIGITGATLIYIMSAIIYVLIRHKHFIRPLAIAPIVFLSGVLLTFLPFLVFEVRHGFNQTQNLWHAYINSLLYGSAVVGQVGLTKLQIGEALLDILAKLLHVPPAATYILLSLSIIALVYHLNKGRVKLTTYEKKLLLFIITATVSILYLYLTSKNPVWSYHFIAVEVLLLLLIGVFANKFRLARVVLFVWVLYQLTVFSYRFITTFNDSPLAIPSLAAKELTVRQVYEDARATPFVVYVYSPAIYTYDYDYLFPWIGTVSRYSMPLPDPALASSVYLIIPESDTATQTAFTDVKTPSDVFTTAKEWKNLDGTVVIKREKIAF